MDTFVHFWTVSKHICEMFELNGHICALLNCIGTHLWNVWTKWTHVAVLCICYFKVFNQGAPPPPCALPRASKSSRVRHLVNPSAMMQAPVPSVAVIICPRTHNQDCVHLVQKAHTCVHLVQTFHKCVPIQFKSAQMCPFSSNISQMCFDTVQKCTNVSI